MEDAKSFVGIDKECLEWRHRGIRLVEEILRSEADIICLQECDRIEVCLQGLHSYYSIWQQRINL